MTSKSITLSRPITGHDKTITEVKIREPRGRDYIDLGEPRLVSKASDGSLQFKEDREVVRQYLERCIDADPLLILNGCSLADAARMKECLFGFFDLAIVESPPPSASSLSTSDS